MSAIPFNNDYIEGYIDSLSLPSCYMTFNGYVFEEEIPGYRTVSIEGRESLLFDYTDLSMNVKDGAIFSRNRVTPRDIIVHFNIVTDSVENYQKSWNGLKRLCTMYSTEMVHDQVYQIIFADESDVYYNGVIVDIKEEKLVDGRSGSGTLTIHCSDPCKYSIELFEAERDPEEENIWLIDYDGTYISKPIIEVKANDDMGGIAVVDQNGKMIQVGSGDDPNKEGDVGNVVLINAYRGNTGFSTKYTWYDNFSFMGNFYPYDYEHHKARGTMSRISSTKNDKDGTLGLDNPPYGGQSGVTENNVWYGPAKTVKIPADSLGDDTVEDFDCEIVWTYDNGGYKKYFPVGWKMFRISFENCKKNPTIDTDCRTLFSLKFRNKKETSDFVDLVRICDYTETYGQERTLKSFDLDYGKLAYYDCTKYLKKKLAKNNTHIGKKLGQWVLNKKTWTWPTTSAKIYSTKYPNSYPYTLSVYWKQTSINFVNNTSVIEITGTLKANGVGFSDYDCSNDLMIWWQDNNEHRTWKKVKTMTVNQVSKNGSKTITGKITVKHNADGSLAGWANVDWNKSTSSKVSSLTPNSKDINGKWGNLWNAAVSKSEWWFKRKDGTWPYNEGHGLGSYYRCWFDKDGWFYYANYYHVTKIQKRGKNVTIITDGQKNKVTLERNFPINMITLMPCAWFGWNKDMSKTLYYKHDPSFLVRTLKFTKVNTLLNHYIDKEDVITIDTNYGTIRRNEVQDLKLGAIGNDWETFSIAPGMNQIKVSYAEVENEPDISIFYRKVYL